MLWFAVAAALAAPSFDEPVRSGVTAPGDAALLVGIEDYAFLPDVPHVRRDLAAMSDLLVYTRGIPPEHVVRLDGASVEQMRAGLRRALDARAPDGILWVYFAGHGAADPASGQLLLVGDDARPDPDVFTARSLPVDALLSELPDGSVVMLDTCWAGAARGDGALVPDSRFAVPTYAIEAPPEVTLWTAASPSQVAGAYVPARHGAFTYFAVGALRGWADGELTGTPDGQVDLNEASAFMSRALAAVGMTHQTPALSGPTVTRLTSGRLEEGPRLAELPWSGPLAVIYGAGELTGVLGIGTRVPSHRESADALIEAGFVAPLRQVGRRRYADVNGRTLELHDLLESLQGDLDGEAALAEFYKGYRPAAAGGMLVVVGSTVGAFSWIPWFQLGKANRRGLGCSEPDALDYVCIHEGKNRAAGILMTSTASAMLGSGIGLLASSKKRVRSAEARLLEQVNERMAR